MNQVDKEKILKETARWIDKDIAPNLYAVATLKQKLGSHGGCFKSWVVGNRDRYSAAYDQFIRRLSRRLYGDKIYRKYKKLIPNVATLEGDGINRRYHLNIMLQRPDWIPHWKFQLMIEKEWSRCPWAMTDVRIEERTGDCVSYSLKEGLETLLICGKSL